MTSCKIPSSSLCFYQQRRGKKGMETRGSEVLGPIIKSTTLAPECEIHADGNPGISW